MTTVKSRRAAVLESLRHRNLAGDIGGGLTGGLVSIPLNVPNGMVALAPLGAAASGLGILAMFMGAAFSNAIFVALRRTPGLQGGGTMSIALVIAGIQTQLLAKGLLEQGADGLVAAMAAVILTTSLAGCFIAGLALTGLGRFVPMIPFPVIAGITNATATLMVITQFRAFVGLSDGPVWGASWSHPGSLLVGCATMLPILRPAAIPRGVPPVIVAVLCGVGMHYAIVGLLPAQQWASFAGPVLGLIPEGSAHWHAVSAAWPRLLSTPAMPLLTVIVPAALSIAMLCGIDTLTGASTMQDVSRSHRSAQPDLLAVAMGNVVGGLVGCLPITGGVSSSMVVWSAGGRAKLAGFIRAAVIGVAALVLPKAIAWLPLSVVAGLVVANAYRLVDRESVRMVHRAATAHGRNRSEIAGNVVVVAAVVLAALAGGMAAAVLTGLALSLVVFVVSLVQATVRRTYIGPIGRSRTRRSEQETAFLLSRRASITVVELQGALFFGSGEQIVRQIERAMTRGATYVILDLRRVTSLDVSAARRMLQIAERFWQNESGLLIASVPIGSAPWEAFERLGALERLRPDRVFSGLEEAMEHAESGLLATMPFSSIATDGDAAAALQTLGVPPVAIAGALALMSEISFDPDVTIIRAGDAAGALYVLLEGSVDVLIQIEGDGVNTDRRTRVATMTGGTMFGEMALLSGAPRAADVVARGQVRCLVVDTDAVQQMQRDHPAAAYALMRAIAVQLAQNLRLANDAIASSEA